jgi:hypothetical protein
MTTESGLLEWFTDDEGYQAAKIRLADRPGILRQVPFGKLTCVEVTFPMIATASDKASSYFRESTQAWIDEIGAEPMPAKD